MSTPAPPSGGFLPGDKLYAPLNAPKASSVTSGVQPGVSNAVVLAQYVIVFGGTAGVFIYAGSPAKGNPPIYSMSNADADPYGNAVKPGIWAGPEGLPQAGLQAQANSNFGALFLPVPGTGFLGDAVLLAVEAGGGSTVEMSSAEDAAPNNDRTELLLYDNLSSGIGSAFAQAAYFDTSAVFHELWGGGWAGLTIDAGRIAAVDPSTGTSKSNVFAPETWHTVTTDAGWGSLGEPPQYRLLADSGLVALRGDISHAGTTVQTAVNSGSPLPAAYRPGATRYYRPPQAADSAGAIQVDPSGVISMRASGFSATQAILDGIYSL